MAGTAGSMGYCGGIASDSLARVAARAGRFDVVDAALTRRAGVLMLALEFVILVSVVIGIIGAFLEGKRPRRFRAHWRIG